MQALQIILYVDPGSGSYLFQLLIAGFLAVAFFFKTIKYKIQSLFNKLFSKKNGKNETDS